MTTLGSAISKSLLTQLPAAMAAKFSVSEAEAREFMAAFLASQFTVGGKAAAVKRNTAKGTNGKGPLSNYIVFANANRASVQKENPSFKLPDIGRELGNRWKALSDADKTKWSAKAAAMNASNGLSPSAASSSPAVAAVTASPAAAQTSVATPVKRAARPAQKA